MATVERPLLLTVREVSQLLRIHRPKVYDLIRANTIEGFKLGSDWRIKIESVERLIGRIPDEFFEKRHQAGVLEGPTSMDEIVGAELS